MKLTKKILVSIFGLTLLFSQSTWGMVQSVQIDVKSEAAFLIEPSSGEILYQKNCDRQMHPASVTKLMVMLLTMEALKRSQIKLTDVVSASPEACKMGGSQIWLEPGEQMTVAELLKAVCIVSANDASYALGEHLAGSEENFIALMNKRAKELGMKNTIYVNTTGLEPKGGGEGNLTTVADQAKLALEVIKHPMVFQWSGVWIDSLRGGKSFLRNTNKLVRFYKGCDGLKTGFTGEAGYCLAATAKREGVRLIAVVMKARTIDERSQDVAKLFNYGFSKYKAQVVYNGGETVGKIRVFRGEEQFVNIKVANELSAVMKRDASGKIQKKIEMSELLQAPIINGQKVGEVLLSYDGKICGKVDLIAAKEVKRISIIQLWRDIFDSIIRAGVSKQES